MFFRPCTGVFDTASLHDLRACADTLLGRVETDRTSLGNHLPNAGARALIVAAVRRFYDGPLPGLFAELYGMQPGLNLGFTTIRRQAPDAPETRVGWHIDLNFSGDTGPFLVAWVPLEAVGGSRPGLDVCVPDGTQSNRPVLAAWRGKADRRGPMVFADDEVEPLLGAGRYRTESMTMSAGDAAVFDQFVLHRTQDLPNATDARRSFEFRMTDLDALPLAWRKSAGVFCRASDRVPGGVEFLVKRADEPLQPVDTDGLDDLAGLLRSAPS